MTEETLFDRGLKVRKEVLGEDYVNKSIAGADEFTRTMAVEVVYWPTLDATGIEGSRDVLLGAYRGVRDGLRTRIGATFGWRAAGTT